MFVEEQVNVNVNSLFKNGLVFLPLVVSVA